MNASRNALMRDLLAGGLPWLPYGLGLSLGHLALGAAVAALLLLALRITAWREFKIFDLAILAFFLLVGFQRCCPTLEQLTPYRSMLLPSLLAVAAFGSSLLGKPCTLQYAREMVGSEWWFNYHFIRVNHIVTVVWGFCFLGMTGLARYATFFGRRGGIVAVIGSITLFALAAWFSHKFPRWYRFHCYVPLVRSGKERFIRVVRR